MNPFAPKRLALTVVMIGFVTLITGEPELVASVRAFGTVVLVEAAFTIQFVSGVVSPKTRFPIVRAASRGKVLFVVMFSVLKSAVLSVPSAITPLFQLAVLVQLPLAFPFTRF